VAPVVRTIREEETPIWLDSLSSAFLEPFDPIKVAEEVRPLWDYSRVWAALEDETIVGTFRSWATELTLPGGGRLPGSAVAGVSVRPTHRRRGILSEMAAAEHGAARERGEAVAVLYSSEYPIYGRFGYGPSSPWATWTLDASGTRFHAESTGSIEFAKPSTESRDAIKDIFEAWRLGQAGELRRRDFTWDLDLGLRESVWGPTWKGYLCLHRDASGQLDGYVRYRPEEKWTQRQPRNILNVDELHALNDDAYAALWQFLANVDTVATIKAERRRPLERLPWLLTNARAAEPSDMGDGLWVALLDPARALAARAYQREGSLVLEAIDRAGADSEREVGHRIALEAGPAGATCKVTVKAPDLTLDLAALGAAYLGGVRLRDAVAARGADEHRAGALAEADALFATADPPWCSTFF